MKKSGWRHVCYYRGMQCVWRSTTDPVKYVMTRGFHPDECKNEKDGPFEVDMDKIMRGELRMCIYYILSQCGMIKIPCRNRKGKIVVVGPEIALFLIKQATRREDGTSITPELRLSRDFKWIIFDVKKGKRK